MDGEINDNIKNKNNSDKINEDDKINKTIEYLLKWILGIVIVKNLPNKIDNFYDITKIAFILGALFAILDILVPNISHKVKENLLLVLAIKILTL